MAKARQVKNRIKTAQNISKITKAMEMVAASKMRKAQNQAVQSRPYVTAVIDTLTTIGRENNISLHPLFENHQMGTELLICIATDRGLSGSFNPTLFRELLNWKQKHQRGSVLVIGRKAITFAQFAGIQTYAQFSDFPDVITQETILPITELAMNGFLEKTFSTVTLLYMDFINTLSQKVKLQELLPIQDPTLQGQKSPFTQTEYLFEPSVTEILSELLPLYIESTVFQAFLESKASEHSARMVAMKNASENAKDLVGELQLLFNKSRQASITNELLEITTATLSLNA